jgi:hypothetical protein
MLKLTLGVTSASVNNIADEGSTSFKSDYEKVALRWSANIHTDNVT